MRRILLIAAMLLPVTSAMAAVTITTSLSSQFNIDGVAHKTVTVGYTSDADVRAFALDINVGNPTGINIGDTPLSNFKVGDNNAVSKGYGIFPGRFRDFINPTTPNWQDPNYNPSTPWAAPGAENTGLGWPRIVVELGTLYAGDANKPALTGNLFSFDVNSEGNTGGVMKIDAEALRGGVVGSDATAMATNLPIYVSLGFTQGVTVPDCVGLNYSREQCISAILTATLVVGVEGNVPGTGQAMRQVIAQKPAGGSTVAAGTAVDFNAVSWPVKPGASFYANWLNRGRPACWAYPRQCRGDGNGIKTGQYWVQAGDLSLYKSAANKTEAQLLGITGGICADFNRTKTGQYWVQAGDLSIYKSFANKAEASVPLCGSIPSPVTYPPGSPDPNVHYWCLPTSGVCPTGQYCAPAAICPNSP